MFKFLIGLCLVVGALCASLPDGLQPQTEGRIVGGANANIANYPWQVSIQRFGVHSCGGAIYSNGIVITAAQCLQRLAPTSLKVRAGSPTWNAGGVLVNVASYVLHESYNPTTKVNDIAVLRLASTLTFSATIKSIPLGIFAPSDGAAAYVSGWGTTVHGGSTLPTTLQFAQVRVISQAQCATGAYGYGTEIKASMICATDVGRDACEGDAGSALVSGGNLVGIYSWGYGCGYYGYPGVYADVAALRLWIINSANSI